MIKLLKKFSANYVAPKEQETTARPMADVIKEIHESFYTEVDRLLADAKIANSLDTDKQGLLEKCARLESLGFSNTKEVREAQAEIRRLENLKLENEVKKSLIEVINYFSFKYPMYKFITKQSVEKICEKYNLVYGPIDRYMGTVPDKNLKDIEDFKVSEEDECYMYEEVRLSSGIRREVSISKYISFHQYIRHQEKVRRLGGIDEDERGLYFGVKRESFKSPLEIAAPISDFDMRDAKVTSYNISDIKIPDPIVLKPVIYNNEKYYLIVTAWGLEAADELVINPIHN